MGSYKNPRIFDAEELWWTSQALQKVEIEVADFREILYQVQEGDFVYFDPPYAPLSKTASFTSYTENPFGENEQRELANIFRQLDKQGCKLMLSNSWLEPILKLYEEFNCIQVKASRAINSNPDRRGKISELVVLNYDPPNSIPIG
jgi:DNA adenine methylase